MALISRDPHDKNILIQYIISKMWSNGFFSCGSYWHTETIRLLFSMFALKNPLVARGYNLRKNELYYLWLKKITLDSEAIAATASIGSILLNLPILVMVSSHVLGPWWLQLALKRTVHPKMKIVLPFTHLGVIQKGYHFLCSVVFSPLFWPYKSPQFFIYQHSSFVISRRNKHIKV